MPATKKPPDAKRSTANATKRKAPSAKKTSAKRAPARKRTTRSRSPKPPDVNLGDAGARVIGVTGPFGAVTLVEMPTSLALAMFPDGLKEAAPLDVIEAVKRDLETIRKDHPEVADSAIAAAALTLAREMSSPYNSATSKSMCARELREHFNRLRELAPPDEEDDRLDDLARRRAERLAGRAAS